MDFEEFKKQVTEKINSYSCEYNKEPSVIILNEKYRNVLPEEFKKQEKHLFRYMIAEEGKANMNTDYITRSIPIYFTEADIFGVY